MTPQAFGYFSSPCSMTGSHQAFIPAGTGDSFPRDNMDSVKITNQMLAIRMCGALSQ
jgi:hypothetical protein